MNRTIVLAIAFACVACRKDGAASNPPSSPTAADTDPAPSQPAANPDVGVPPASAGGATDAEAPIDDEGHKEVAAALADQGPAKPLEDPAEGLTSPKDFALVKLEIKLTDGKVYKDPKGKVIDWSTPTQIAIDFGGHKHEFVLQAARDGKSGVALEVDYNMDGTEIIRSHAITTKLTEREVVRVEDGSALAVTVTNKKVKPKPQPKRDTIQGPKEKDPLAGAEKKG